ncbi:MAG: AEC family transporter [Candidatus Omnitrophota bacterium]
MEFSFYTIAVAVAKLFVLMAVGYILYLRKAIDEKFTDVLSLILIRVIFPALIISKTTTFFSFNEYKFWWLLPLAAVIFSLSGMALSTVFRRFLKGFIPFKEFMCVCGFQNCGYLPMNLILFSFAGMLGNRLLVYLFLFIMGFNLLMWSFVPFFLSGSFKNKMGLGVFLNPPVVATIFSLLWVAFMGKASMPAVIADPVKQLGLAAFPLAMLTLGAYLCKYRGYRPRNKRPLVISVFTKLFLFPALVFGVLVCAPLSYDYKFFLFLQSIMPTAVSLVVVGSYTGADNEFFSSVIFYTHLIAVFSIPLWLSVFKLVVQS